MDIRDLVVSLSPEALAQAAYDLEQRGFHLWTKQLLALADQYHDNSEAVHHRFSLFEAGNLTIRPTVDPSDERLSHLDYHTSHEIQLDLLRFGDDYYYAMIAAMMLLSDTYNAERFKTCWPKIWDDYVTRKGLPNGRLPEESC